MTPRIPDDDVPPSYPPPANGTIGTRRVVEARRRARDTSPGLGSPPLRDAFSSDEEDSALQSADSLTGILGEKSRENRELRAKLAQAEAELAQAQTKVESAPPDVERTVGRWVIAALKRYGVSVAALGIAVGAVAKPAAAPERVDGQADRLASAEREIQELKARERTRAKADLDYRADNVAWLKLLAGQLNIEARPNPDAPAPADISITQVRMPNPNRPKDAPLWRSDVYLPRP